MPEPQPKVLQVTGRIIIDAAGVPVQGYHVDFQSPKGMKGFVEIPAAQYTPEAVKAAIKEEASKLDSILLM